MLRTHKNRRLTSALLMYGDLYSKLETSKKLDDICSVVGWLGGLRARSCFRPSPKTPAFAITTR
jgi:hypothetical protein